MNLSTDELYARYSKEGQKDVDNLSKESTLTKELFLRNVGRHIKPGGLFTTGFKATNGKAVDLLDGKNRIILSWTRPTTLPRLSRPCVPTSRTAAWRLSWCSSSL